LLPRDALAANRAQMQAGKPLLQIVILLLNLLFCMTMRYRLRLIVCIEIAETQFFLL
jgi:hypothetical protein